MASEELRVVIPNIHKHSPQTDGKLARDFTWEGQGGRRNKSPPVEWYNVPEGAETLALVVQDIDAPDPEGPIVPWTQWVVVNIPPKLKGLPEGFSGKAGELGGDYAHIEEGNNDYKVPGWRGIKVPTSGHRFEFKLYALDTELQLGRTVTKERVLDAIQGHVLGEAVVIGVF